jgi:hypothetical protein
VTRHFPRKVIFPINIRRRVLLYHFGLTLLEWSVGAMETTLGCVSLSTVLHCQIIKGIDMCVLYTSDQGPSDVRTSSHSEL